MPEHFDVLIVGAGLSGIGAARQLQINCPRKTFAILEGRENLGGTWDLFRYPGIRSDSDMHTMAFSFRPWTGERSIAPGDEILTYLKETAEEYGITDHIRYSQGVKEVRWSSANARWTVIAEAGPNHEPTIYTCSFLFMCTGYYNYEKGNTPTFPGADQFRGRIIHPQQWPQDLNYTGKQVVIIGSGATAITLVPAMAKTAGHVTMLQRSPTYILALPGRDVLLAKLRRWMPVHWARNAARWKNIAMNLWFYSIARKKPEKISAAIVNGARQRVGPDVDAAVHFTPAYKPFDQRVCIAPDGDIFESLRNGEASIVTDTIERFTETGILLASGKHLPADIIVTATGLKLEILSGIAIVVDDQPIALNRVYNYRGTMFSGVPNFALTVGYTNLPWTLKAELVSKFVCRVINYMDRHKFRSAVPRPSTDIGDRPLWDLQSGYVQRELPNLPRQGTKTPWALRSYPHDRMNLHYGKVNDGELEFTR
ncbi:MAG TPA: NAD(P)/FAD-dependent oxidoreductase [Acidobacteriaceae bacterium]|nr:NAD(P)/FAD-dependent oxidoreductase [Acidobacteriaceae bacterium]